MRGGKVRRRLVICCDCVIDPRVDCGMFLICLWNILLIIFGDFGGF